MSRPFSDATDIANRACQHVGASRIAPGALFTEDSKQAGEISACYDQLRVSELRRNVWRFSIRTAALRPVNITTMLLVASAYSATARYIVGSVVSYNGSIFIGSDPNNTGNQPDTSNDYWQQYFGPLTVNLFDSTTSYFAGELVYGAVSNNPVVYLSMSNISTDDPTTIAAYDATVTYKQGDTATYSSATWQSNIDLNLNNTPAALTAFDIAHSYSIGNQVLGSNNHNYTSVTNTNVGNDPTLDSFGTNWTDNGPAPWIAVPATQPDQMQGQNWLKLSDATLKSIYMIYPPNSGPVGQPYVRNVYWLPNNFLRMAPQDPKAGSVSFLGAPSGRQYDDWEFQDDFIITQEVRPIVLRFAADVANVSKYDPMFCEGLGARIGYEVCEALTQSVDKQKGCSAAYQKFMSEARIVNSIETGADEPALDNYIACRV